MKVYREGGTRCTWGGGAAPTRGLAAERRRDGGQERRQAAGAARGGRQARRDAPRACRGAGARLRCRKQARLKPLQRADGTHRLADPVSKTTEKVWGGVPREISP
eukprot:scaffold11117_cov79-Isochrysis_galbana.AAC.3